MHQQSGIRLRIPDLEMLDHHRPKFRLDREQPAVKVEVAALDRDVDTLDILNDLGHQEFGVYAEVIEGGEVKLGDPVAVAA